MPGSYVRRLKSRDDNWKHPGLEEALEYWERVAPRPPKEKSKEKSMEQLKGIRKERPKERPKTGTKTKREIENNDGSRFSIRERKIMGIWGKENEESRGTSGTPIVLD